MRYYFLPIFCIHFLGLISNAYAASPSELAPLQVSAQQFESDVRILTTFLKGKNAAFVDKQALALVNQLTAAVKQLQRTSGRAALDALTKSIEASLGQLDNLFGLDTELIKGRFRNFHERYVSLKDQFIKMCDALVDAAQKVSPSVNVVMESYGRILEKAFDTFLPDLQAQALVVKSMGDQIMLRPGKRYDSHQMAHALADMRKNLEQFEVDLLNMQNIQERAISLYRLAGQNPLKWVLTMVDIGFSLARAYRISGPDVGRELGLAMSYADSKFPEYSFDHLKNAYDLILQIVRAERD